MALFAREVPKGDLTDISVQNASGLSWLWLKARIEWESTSSFIRVETVWGARFDALKQVWVYDQSLPSTSVFKYHVESMESGYMQFDDPVLGKCCISPIGGIRLPPEKVSGLPSQFLRM